MAVIAAALGNSEAICARHYAHLAPGYVAETIRAATEGQGLVPAEPDAVTPFAPAQPAQPTTLPRRRLAGGGA